MSRGNLGEEEGGGGGGTRVGNEERVRSRGRSEKERCIRSGRNLLDIVASKNSKVSTPGCEM